MAPSAKGKEKVIDDGEGSCKRKRPFDNDGKDGGRKGRNRGVLQFFEDAAYDVGEDGDDGSDDDSFFDNDFVEDEFDIGDKFQEPNGAPLLIPKLEEPTDEELEKILQERYKPGSAFVTYEEDNYESKRSVDIDDCSPLVKEPTIWKVKCVVGRERHTAFCLMQKYVDLNYLGNKLHIISAFSVDHIKGFIYIEADNERDIYEACNGLCNIYSSRVTPVPMDDVSHLFAIRSWGDAISVGMWARVKNGKYKGDLAQVAAVNKERKKVTVKLIPRIDMKALAEKFGRGTSDNRAVNPAPRLISSSELEEFRPLIQFRRDRDTNKVFEVLDGMMLKDGYLFKKVSIDSLSLWGVSPRDDELLKFEPSKDDGCKDLEWLSQLYGERKRKRPLVYDKGSGKGDCSSGLSGDNNFEINDLVFFGRKDFGVIIGTEKEETFKIIKAGSEVPVVVTIQQRDLKNASFDKKLFTALDQQRKSISINDTVRILEGPLKDREGTVKRIYRGIIFLSNETVEENNGYFCIKSQMCEKVELSAGSCNEKGGELGPSGFRDFPSPKSPLSPKQSEQGRDGSRNFKREDDAMFSVGQSLRIRVGPLKGYLCRVLAIRRSDVTVKIDSQHKILTVKCEHLSEVRAKRTGISSGEDANSLMPFDLLGTQDGARDWMDGASKAVEGGSWNAEGFSNGRSTWSTFPDSNLLPEAESHSKSMDDGANKDSSWEPNATRSEGTSWCTAAAARDGGQVDGWGNLGDNGKKVASNSGFGNGASDGWGKAVGSLTQASGKEIKDDAWGQAAGNMSVKGDSSGSKSAWNASGVASVKATTCWGNTSGSSDTPEATSWKKANTSDEGQTNSWGAVKKDGEGTGWGNMLGSSDIPEATSWKKATTSVEGQTNSWGAVKKDGEGTGWGNPLGSTDTPEATSWKKATTSDEGLTNSQGAVKRDGEVTGMWGKDAEASAWNQSAGVAGGSSSWNKQDAGPSSCKQTDGSPWSKPGGGSSSWSSQGGGSTWSKPEAGSAPWSKEDSAMKNRGNVDQNNSWGRSGSFSGGQDSGGRRGRGLGRGGRGQFGRGRSFGQGETSGWRERDQDDGSRAGTFEGNNSGWGKNTSFNQDKGDVRWDKQNAPSGEGSTRTPGWGSNKGNSEWGIKSGTGWNGSRADNESSDWQNKSNFGSSKSSDGAWSSGWNDKSVSNDKKGGSSGDTWCEGVVSTSNQVSGWGKGTSDSGRADWDDKSGGKTPGDNPSSGWNTTSKAHQESGEPVSGGGWEKRETLVEKSESAWKTSTSSLDGNQSSAWGGKSSRDAQKTSLDNNSQCGQKSTGGKMDVEVDESGVWKKEKTPDGGSSSGWSQGKGSRVTDAVGGSSSGWGQNKGRGATDAAGDSSSVWGQSKASGATVAGGGSSSGWGQRKGSGATDDSGGSFSGSGQSKLSGASDSGGGSSLGWGQGKGSGASDAGGGSSSCWGQSKLSGATDAGGDSSSGWGQSKWRGSADTGGNENSRSNTSNWKSEGKSEDQTDTFGDQGRGGNWRGGRGGRWGQDRGGSGGRGGSERGGFRGRGGSDCGGFGGRGGGSEHGGFRGRCGSDRGEFGGRGRSDWGGGSGGRGRSDRGDFCGRGRGGSDRGGFHGRASFGGRGRGMDDWNKNDSGEDSARTPCSWTNSSAKDASWTNNSGGDWGRGAGNKSQWQSGTSGWNVSEGSAAIKSDAQDSGWSKVVTTSEDSGRGGEGQWESGRSGWNVSEGAAGGGDDAQGSGWNKGIGSSKDSGGNDALIEQAGGWTGGLSLSKDGGSDGNTSGWNIEGSRGGKTNSSGEAASSGWNQADAGKVSASSSDAWGKPATSSWGQKSDGNGEKGW